MLFFQIAIPQLKSLIYAPNAESEEASKWAEMMLVAATPHQSNENNPPADPAAVRRGLKNLITFLDSWEEREKEASKKEEADRRKKN